MHSKHSYMIVAAWLQLQSQRGLLHARAQNEGKLRPCLKCCIEPSGAAGRADSVPMAVSLRFVAASQVLLSATVVLGVGAIAVALLCILRRRQARRGKGAKWIGLTPLSSKPAQQ